MPPLQTRIGDKPQLGELISLPEFPTPGASSWSEGQRDLGSDVAFWSSGLFHSMLSCPVRERHLCFRQAQCQLRTPPPWETLAWEDKQQALGHDKQALSCEPCGSWEPGLLAVHAAAEEALAGQGLVPTWPGPGRPHLLNRLRRTQRPCGRGRLAEGKESCILGGMGGCRASRKKAGGAWNEWD